MKALSQPKETNEGEHRVKIGVKKLNENATIPKYQHEGDAGMDLSSIDDIVIHRGTCELIHTGIAFKIPYGLEGQVCSRSGLALKHQVFVLNSPGVIDRNYVGEICVILMNLGKEDFEVKRGDRIAQMVFSPIVNAELFKVEYLGQTNRGEGGFGSTGK